MARSRIDESGLYDQLRKAISKQGATHQPSLPSQLASLLHPHDQDAPPVHESLTIPELRQLKTMLSNEQRKRILSTTLLSFSDNEAIKRIVTNLYIAMMDLNHDLSMDYPMNFSIARCPAREWLAIITASNAFNLTALHVSNNELHRCDKKRWKEFLDNINISSLEEVSIIGNNPHPLEELNPQRRHELLDRIKNITTLKIFSLSGCQLDRLDERSWQKITDIIQKCSLEELDISHCNIGEL